MDAVTQVVNALAEIERMGLLFEWAGQDEILVLCPYHQDSKPSCGVNLAKKCFRCRAAGCEKSGDIIELLSAILKQPRSILYLELAKRYNVETEKIVDIKVVEKAHLNIWSAAPLIEELRKRALYDDDIRQWRLGVEANRITIPIKGRAGFYINIRKYLPGAPGREKMRNLSGRGKQTWYPIDQLKYQQIMLCGGECKALVALRELNPHNVGAISPTSGEHNLDMDLLDDLRGKDVVVCLDIDRAGRQASKLRCAQVAAVAKSVREAIIPLDIAQYPKGDINDYVAFGGDMWPVWQSAQEYVPPVELVLTQETPEDTELVTAINAVSTRKRLRVKAVVAAVDDAPYIVPETVEIHCDKSQNMCAVCPVYSRTDQDTFTISPESEHILDMIGTTKKSVREGIMSALRIPSTCPSARFNALSTYNIEDARVSPQLEITNRSADRIVQPAFCIGVDRRRLELNAGYNLVGRVYPHPTTQRSTLLISNYEATEDALSSYKSEGIEALNIFKPKEYTLEGIKAKLDHIYADLEANVTRIFQRRLIHLYVDLAYHSPLFIDFDGKSDIKGWVEVLIMGDSAQGKSEVTCGTSGDGGLMRHYGLGTKLECKNASVAGLLGGCEQLGTRWFVSWGIIPTNDKRLVILEELKGAPIEVIAKLTDMRSSGYAEIDKITKRRTFARTRLIALSNLRGQQVLASHSFGIEAIPELIGSMEDVRRFDACLLLSREEIDIEILNQLQNDRPQIEHTYTSALCRALVLWCWTRKAATFSDTAKKLILSEATKLSTEFTDAIPVIDRGSARLKIARLAAAVAGRTFSHAKSSTDTLLVRECHVQFICEMLRTVYSGPVFGYAEFTEALEINTRLIDPNEIHAALQALPYPKDFAQQILRANKIDVQDLQDWTGWERLDAMELSSFLIRKHAIRREQRSYKKTPPFIVFIRELLDSGKLKDNPNPRKRDY